MADDVYYRQVISQMQSEFTRAVSALEKQVATLTRHNELLTQELAQTKQQQSEWTQEATQTVTQLQHQIQRQVEDAAIAQQKATDKEEALVLEIAALKSLLQQEQDYWTRYDEAGKQDRDRLTQQVAKAKAETLQHLEQNRILRREIKALQCRVDTAVATSNSFEQRLLNVVKEKDQGLLQAETQVAHYKKKVHEKRAQNKYLTEALVKLQTQRQSGERSSSNGNSSTESPKLERSDVEMIKPLESLVQRRRKRELTLPEEIKAAANVTTSKLYTSKKLGVSRIRTSPTSSSPEISPRSARMTPYQRPPSVATTTPTTSDGVSFNSNSSNGSLRSLRSLRNVTTRRRGNRNSSDSDSANDRSRINTEGEEKTSPTGRLERELNCLRRKLDSCIADAAARW
ncbi:hypothetical protein Plhal304r1_c019g0068681 [Plasmopara halstedii]